MARKPMSEEQAANIVSRYQRGQSVNFISFATDYSWSQIRDVLKAAGVKTRGRGSRAGRSWGWTGEAA